MAYTDGYDYDIFISYSHDDDTAPEGRTGWVTEFHDYLSHWLIKKRHLKGMKIWIDDELSGNTLFDRAIEDRISRSALFFVLHSNNYQSSDYCRRELDWFFQHNKRRPEGLMVGDESRLFNILINNIPYTDWPEALSEAGGPTSGFVLHDAEGEGEFGYPTSMDDSRFDRQLRKLVEAIARTLDAFPRKAQTAPSAEVQTSGISLFLADVHDTLRPFRKRLIAEIGDKARILDALPPPYPSAEHDRQLEATLQQANLSIHLLDQWPGRVVDDLEEQTYPRLQAESATRHQTPSLIWVPESLAEEEIEDEQQTAWLGRMEQGELGDTNFQFIRSGRQALIDQVLQTLPSLQQKSDDGVPVSFLIDTHQKDQRYAFKLADLLSEKGVEVEFNKESRDPVKSLTDFEQAVRQVQNLVIMFGKVAPAWLKGRMQTTVKVIADQLQKNNPIPHKLWIVLLPGCPGHDAVPRIPLLRVDLLDNTRADGIAPDLLRQLLDASQEGAYP
jgi:hypothetical protein